MKEKEWEEEMGTAIQLSPILEPLSDCEVASESIKEGVRMQMRMQVERKRGRN